jgi:hypothetical protein
LDSLQKSVACFVMEEGGSICLDGTQHRET